MPIRKWTIQYLIAFPVVLMLLAGGQYFKGRDLDYAIEFGLIWAAISITVFALRRAYNFKKNIACSLCNDLPENKR